MRWTYLPLTRLVIDVPPLKPLGVLVVAMEGMAIVSAADAIVVAGTAVLIPLLLLVLLLLPLQPLPRPVVVLEALL